MAFLGSVAGTLTRMSSYSVEVFADQAITADVFLPGGPAVAQASLSNFNNTSGAGL
jgi:hypothetical protein